MTPENVCWTTVESLIGRLLLTSDGSALTGVYMELHKGGPQPTDRWRRDDGPFRETAAQLADYFAGNLRDFDLPIAFHGTEFQRDVWEALRAIPCGETITYAELAVRVGRAGSARAVGAAVGRNPVSIIVPCHRVVGSSGRLTGYAGGLDRKRWLLEHEGAIPAGLELLMATPERA
jgi:methylated-DNA-[protein]-cysteine S-methyltransferase